MSTLFKVDNLQVKFLPTLKNKNSVKAVRGISYNVEKERTLAIVGESGCGKTVSLLAAMGLLDRGAEIEGDIQFQNRSLVNMDIKSLNQIRGSDIAMIFQDPMTALNPTMKVGDQIAEVLVVHKAYSKKAARQKATDLLSETGIANADLRAGQYPFEFSGGMLQRVAIAMALAGEPQLILADEPTTALDVTVQKQVLQLMKNLQKEKQSALILVTHDLAVVAEVADEVLVMYAGQAVEKASVADLFASPAHPYTQGLKKALPAFDQAKELKLKPIDGMPPDLATDIAGCAFVDRCAKAMRICQKQNPPEIQLSEKHLVSCWLHYEQDSVEAGDK